MTGDNHPRNKQEETRHKIMNAAVQRFTEVGYSEATTREISKRAGVNEVTLFRLFGSKKALLMECVQRTNAQGFSATFEGELSGDYHQDILNMAKRQVADMKANVEVLRMLLCDARSVPELREVLLAGSRGNSAKLTGYFERQVKAGNVREDLPAEAMAIAFDSLFSATMLFEYVFQDSLVPGMGIDSLVLPLVELLVSGTQKTEGASGEQV